MRVANVLMMLPLTLWSLMFVMGYSLYDGVKSQHVPGYPNAGQFHYYVLTPAITAGALILVMVACNWLGRRLSPTAGTAAMLVAVVASMIFLGAFLLPYTGGV